MSFTIGRIRQAHEPWQSGWSYREHTSRGYVGHLEDQRFNFVQKEFIERDRCPPESGCRNASRKAAFQSSKAHRDLSNSLSSHVQLTSDVLDGKLCFNTANVTLPASLGTWDGVMEDKKDDVDMDYSYQSDVDDEPYEYQSEYDSLCDPLEGREDNMDVADGNCSEHSTEALAAEPSDLYEQLRSVTMPTYLGTADSSIAPALQDAGMDTASDSESHLNEDFSDRLRKLAQNEHFAGPGCIHQRGYSGYLIGADEMKGCNVLQCLFRKEPGWTPEPDDQAFELSGNYYLSGLSGHVPSRDASFPLLQDHAPASASFPS